ncbi:hypothetical protein SANTM175S_01184 [Streptomyces antimycoticus]
MEPGVNRDSVHRKPWSTSVPSVAVAAPPAVVVATVTAGLVPPVRPAAEAVIWLTSSPRYWPTKATTIAVPG